MSLQLLQMTLVNEHIIINVIAMMLISENVVNYYK